MITTEDIKRITSAHSAFFTSAELTDVLGKMPPIGWEDTDHEWQLYVVQAVLKAAMTGGATVIHKNGRAFIAAEYHDGKEFGRMIKGFRVRTLSAA